MYLISPVAAIACPAAAPVKTSGHRPIAPCSTLQNTANVSDHTATCSPSDFRSPSTAETAVVTAASALLPSARGSSSVEITTTTTEYRWTASELCMAAVSCSRVERPSGWRVSSCITAQHTASDAESGCEGSSAVTPDQPYTNDQLWDMIAITANSERDLLRSSADRNQHVASIQHSV
jgi:hypothetical protein